MELGAVALAEMLTLLPEPQMLPALLAALLGCGASQCTLPLGFWAAGKGTGTGVLMAAVRASWAADTEEDSELKEGKGEVLPFIACACSAGPAKPGGGPWTADDQEVSLFMLAHV